MRAGCAILLSSFFMSIFRQPQAQIDGSGTEIPAATRLRDYLLRSRYPETNRLLQSDDLSLFEIPLISGDASPSAIITAFAGDKLHRGSLRIFFRVSVRQPGFYSFRTQLISEKGRPLIEALLNQRLKAGEHTLHFFVYGKALKDSGANGSFILPGIVGEKLPEGGLPVAAQHGALSPFLSAYKTQVYRPKDFTDREWTSREKQATIKRLQREIQQEQRNRKNSPS
jgi:hypothetical protein